MPGAVLQAANAFGWLVRADVLPAVFGFQPDARQAASA